MPQLSGCLQIDSASFDVVVSGLVLNFVPEPRGTVAEMARVARRGGAVAAHIWDYAKKMALMRYFWDAAVVLDAVALEFDEGRRFPICQPSPLMPCLRTQACKRSKCARPTSLLTFAISTMIGRRLCRGKAPETTMPLAVLLQPTHESGSLLHRLPEGVDPPDKS